MKFIKSLMPYLIIIVVVVLIRSFVITPIKVTGSSMYPTLDGGEIMILNKLSSIKRFDVVIVKRNNDSESIIKRVIGLPGDTVEVRNDVVYINDEELNPDKYGYLDANLVGLDKLSYSTDKITLDDDEYFVLGDNRLNSIDSHIFGPVKKEEIKGRARLVIFPFKKIGLIK